MPKKPAARRKATRKKAAPKKVDKVYDWAEGARWAGLEVWHLMSNGNLRKRTKGELRQGVLMMEWTSMRDAFDSGKLTGQALKDVSRFLKIARHLNDYEASLLWRTLLKSEGMNNDAESEVLARPFNGGGSESGLVSEGGGLSDEGRRFKDDLSEVVHRAEAAVRPDSPVPDEQSTKDGASDSEDGQQRDVITRDRRSFEVFEETLRQRRASAR